MRWDSTNHEFVFVTPRETNRWGFWGYMAVQYGYMPINNGAGGYHHVVKPPSHRLN